MANRISAETRAAIVQKYLSDENATYRDIGKHFGINHNTISKIIKKELQAGNGVKPDRRVNGELTDEELERRHNDAIAAKDPHPRTLDWMKYVTPLHKHKQELELAVEHKQAELDKAKQELRDFTATLRKLMEDTT